MEKIEKKRSWFAKHKILTAILVLLVLVVIGSAIGGSSKTNQSTPAAPDNANAASSSQSQASKAVPVSSQPQEPVSNYKIAYSNTSQRLDNAETVYVVIDPVDLSNDSFKQKVKTIIKDLAAKKGVKEFSANIYDNADVAAQDYNMTLPNGKADGQTKLAEQGQHLVAEYDGGIDMDTAQVSREDKAYTISWYPGADKTTPNVGKYVSIDEQFKP